jgi:hypothetical protein
MSALSLGGERSVARGVQFGLSTEVAEVLYYCHRTRPWQ